MHDKIELIPGVAVEVPATYSVEEEEAAANIRARQVKQSEMREQRKAERLSRAQSDLARGIPVAIDEELVELGLDKKIRAMQFEAHLVWKIMRHLSDDNEDSNVGGIEEALKRGG